MKRRFLRRNKVYGRANRHSFGEIKSTGLTDRTTLSLSLARYVLANVRPLSFHARQRKHLRKVRAKKDFASVHASVHELCCKYS